MSRTAGRGQANHSSSSVSTGDRSGSSMELEGAARQVAAVRRRLTELHIALVRDCGASATLAAADLGLAWSLLELRLDVIAALQPDDARLALSGHPAMRSIRSALRDGLAKAAEHTAMRTEGMRQRLKHLRQYAGRAVSPHEGTDHGSDAASNVGCPCARRDESRAGDAPAAAQIGDHDYRYETLREAGFGSLEPT